MNERVVILEITERESGRNTLILRATKPVAFEVDFDAQKFADPKVAEYEKIIDAQRVEIGKLLVKQRKPARRRR